MESEEATGKENVGTKKKNLTFLRPRLYMLERRKTDTVVESSASGDHSGTLRRSQSDRTEYNQKLQGNPREINRPRLLLHSFFSPALPFAKKTLKAEEEIECHFLSKRKIRKNKSESNCNSQVIGTSYYYVLQYLKSPFWVILNTFFFLMRVIFFFCYLPPPFPIFHPILEMGSTRKQMILKSTKENLSQ